MSVYYSVYLKKLQKWHRSDHYWEKIKFTATGKIYTFFSIWMADNSTIFYVLLCISQCFLIFFDRESCKVRIPTNTMINLLLGSRSAFARLTKWDQKRLTPLKKCVRLSQVSTAKLVISAALNNSSWRTSRLSQSAKCTSKSRLNRKHSKEKCQLNPSLWIRNLEEQKEKNPLTIGSTTKLKCPCKRNF